MKQNLRIIVSLFVLTIAFYGCDSTNKEPSKKSDAASEEKGKALVDMSDSTDAEFKAVFNKQIQSLLAKDPAGYMTTIAKSGRDSIDEFHNVETHVNLYDLDYKILNFVVIRKDDRTAEVEVEMQVTKRNGPDFEDNISVTRHILGNSDGKWKILESRMIKYTPLKDIKEGEKRNEQN